MSSTKSKTSFIMPDKNVTITPNYTAALPKYRVSGYNMYNKPMYGCGQNYTVGEIVTVKILPEDIINLRFNGWNSYKGYTTEEPIVLIDNGGNRVNLNSHILVFKMPAHDVYLYCGLQ